MSSSDPTATKALKMGAGPPYNVRGVMFKGLQYRVDDRDGGSVYLTRSNPGAHSRAKKLTQLWKDGAR